MIENLHQLTQEFYYITSPELNRSSVWLQQSASPGLTGVIFLFNNDVKGEELRRQFLSSIQSPELLGKANGHRLYCIIRRYREETTDEYLEENAQGIANAMANYHLSRIRNEDQLRRIRDIAPGEKPYGAG